MAWTRPSSRAGSYAGARPVSPVRTADRRQPGPRTRPTTPATTTIVTTYGTLLRSWGGTSTPRIASSVWVAPAKPNTSAAPRRADGCHAPKIIAARAMKPLPAVISMPKLPATASDRYEPAEPGDQPGEEQRPIADRRTSMPTVPAAAGFSPEARSRRPQRVRIHHVGEDGDHHVRRRTRTAWRRTRSGRGPGSRPAAGPRPPDVAAGVELVSHGSGSAGTGSS